MSKSKAFAGGVNDSTDVTLPEDFSESDFFSKRTPRGAIGIDDSKRILSIAQGNNSSKKSIAENPDSIKKSGQDKKSDSDKKIPTGELSDSDFFTKRKQKKEADDSTKRLPNDESFRRLPSDARESSVKRPDLERKVSESRRQSITGVSRRGQVVVDATNSSGSTLDGATDGRKGIISDLFRRATTKDLSNLSGSELPGHITRRNSVSSGEEFRKQQPVLTRMNSKLNGLLKTMRWIDDNDGSRARKLVKNMADFGQRYTMTKTIGRGTQGKIYIGQCKQTEAPVIIKIIDETAIKSFNYVGKLPISIFLLKILNNPEEDQSNPLFIQYLDHFHVEKTWILVTLYEGDAWVDLHAFLKKRKIPLTEQEIMFIFTRIIQALSDIQTLGFTHNDIKDSNILINSETLNIKLIDLDSCRQISDDLIPASEFAGTIYYASPEVRTGNFFSPELQEIYALGILLLSIIFLSRMPQEIERYLMGNEKEMLDPHTLSKIFRDHKIDLSSSMIKVIQSMISRKPSRRPDIPDLLGFVHGD